MITITLPCSSSQEQAACRELEDALGASQVAVKVSEDDESGEKSFTFDDADEKTVTDTLSGLGISLEEVGAEDAWGRGENIYRTEDVDDMIDAVLEGGDPDAVYDVVLDEIRAR